MSETELPTAESDEALGRMVGGKFRLEEAIGEGAFGRVYRAEDTTLRRSVAIKLVHRHLTGDGKVARRFHREARAASRLSHPNSLQVLDFGEEDDGTLYLAMELLDGRNLSVILETDGPLTPRRIVLLLTQVLRALDEAHGAGVVHRDLKPENVLVRSDRSGREHVKVCDFGIAKITEGESRSGITRDGFVCGTPEYMSPEQARGEPVDARADVYAAGALLYEMLTGDVPFRAETALGVVTRHLTEAPTPPRQRQPAWAIPSSLAAVAMRALEKDREERFGSAGAMADELERALSELEVVADRRLDVGDAVGADGAATGWLRVPGSAEQPSFRTTEDLRARPGRSARWLGAAGAAVLLVAALAWATSRPAEVAAPAAPSAETQPGEPPTAEAPPPEEPVAESFPPPADPPAAPEAPVPVVATPRRARRTARPREPAPPDPPATSPPPIAAPRTSVEAPAPARSAVEEGRARLLAGELAAAIQAFEQAARQNPSDPRPQQQLGRAYMRAGDVPSAVAAYRRYLELRPDAPDRAIVERIITNGP